MDPSPQERSRSSEGGNSDGRSAGLVARGGSGATGAEGTEGASGTVSVSGSVYVSGAGAGNGAGGRFGIEWTMPVINKETRNDLMAGWLGGAVGILISNPLEVLKVRLQTNFTPPPATPVPSHTSSHHHQHSISRPSAPCLFHPSHNHHNHHHYSNQHHQNLFSSFFTPQNHQSSQHSHPHPNHHHHSHNHHHHPSSPSHSHSSPSKTSASPRPRTPFLSLSSAFGIGNGLRALWKEEGWRFLYAGAAAPIVGLAFIDSAFFGLYGVGMGALEQDRDDPSSLDKVFLAGASAGGICALLQTPIEVVKCRAQAEEQSVGGRKLGSFRIARLITQTDGLRGFYVGGLMTACRDSVSSGLFFYAYYAIRKMLRGDSPPTGTLAAASSSNARLNEFGERRPIKEGETTSTSGNDWGEVGRIFIAGGIAGSLSAMLPYPLDIIKTRLQVARVTSRAHAQQSTSTTSSASSSSPVSSQPSSTASSGSSSSSPNPNRTTNMSPSSHSLNHHPHHTPAPSLQQSFSSLSVHPSPASTPLVSIPISSSSVSSTSTTKPSSSTHHGVEPEPLTVRETAKQIYREGLPTSKQGLTESPIYRFFDEKIFRRIHQSSSSTMTRTRLPSPATSLPSSKSSSLMANPSAAKWTLRFFGLKSFLKGLPPTVLSSFVGSSVTIVIFEVAVRAFAKY